MIKVQENSKSNDLCKFTSYMMFNNTLLKVTGVKSKVNDKFIVTEKYGSVNIEISKYLNSYYSRTTFIQNKILF